MLMIVIREILVVLFNNCNCLLGGFGLFQIPLVVRCKCLRELVATGGIFIVDVPLRIDEIDTKQLSKRLLPLDRVKGRRDNVRTDILKRVVSGLKMCLKISF